ncbi:MAG: iron-sulfur cluster co-chaperone HscB C-terminal domain-containing protein [Planctomycetota bacterium]
MAPNPFDTLGLPVRFDLTHTQIEQAFMVRMAQAHPDLAGDSAEADAAALNDAKRQLADPESRARAVLAIRAPNAEAPPLSPEFLAEILEVRQEAEEATASGDQEAVERWRAWAAERRAAIISELESSLGGDTDSVDESKASIAVGVLQQWRYFERMLEQVGVPAHAPDA